MGEFRDDKSPVSKKIHYIWRRFPREIDILIIDYSDYSIVIHNNKIKRTFL
jgi:hypothetical protein